MLTKRADVASNGSSGSTAPPRAVCPHCSARQALRPAQPIPVLTVHADRSQSTIPELAAVAE
jgi:hypothetical protein